MSDNPIQDAIADLDARERELELEAVCTRACIEEVRRIRANLRAQQQREGRKRPGPKAGPRVVTPIMAPVFDSTEPTDAT